MQMPKTRTVHLQPSTDDYVRSLVTFDDGVTEKLWMTAVGPDLYRLEETSIGFEASYGDTIRCDLMDDGSLSFREITERSKLITLNWTLSLMTAARFSADSFGTDPLRSVLDSVVAAGGRWERIMGGMLMVHTPAEIADDVSGQVNRMLRAFAEDE